MNDKKIAHLGFIQGIINRLGNDSFLIKGWCVALVTGLAALSSNTKTEYLLVSIFPIIIFWFLDTYFLWQEKLYRSHYFMVSKKTESMIDFSMVLTDESKKKEKYCEVFRSSTILPFYLGIFICVLIFLYVLGISV